MHGFPMGGCCGGNDGAEDSSQSDLRRISTMMDQIHAVIMRPNAGVMQMFPGGPDVGLGVGAKHRDIRFVRQSNSGEEARWARPCEEIVAHYRLTPGSMFKMADIINWMRMNGVSMCKLQGIVHGLRSQGIEPVVEC